MSVDGAGTPDDSRNPHEKNPGKRIRIATEQKQKDGRHALSPVPVPVGHGTLKGEMCMGKVKKNLGIGQILLSAVFLFNPEVSVIDPLPDFIGYLQVV